VSGYTWSYWHYPVDAEVVGREVEQIAAEHGSCSPRVFVDRARPAESPLHPLLIWDNAKAAEEYRINQARQVISRLRIVVKDRPQPAPAFVHVAVMPGGRPGGYVSTLRAMSDAEMREQALREALRQLDGLRRRHESLVELRPLWDAIDEVIGQVDGAAGQGLPGA
jgi:hypothetical protein